jgi:hypothetical protein
MAILRDKDYTYDEKSESYVGPCEPTLYKSVFFGMNNYFYEIPPQYYVLSQKATKPMNRLSQSNGTTPNPNPNPTPNNVIPINGNYCMLAFQPSADDNWVLGTSFLRNYYSVWDHDNSRVGLAIHRTSTAQINSYTFMPLPIETIDNQGRNIEHNASEFMLAGAIIAGQLGLQGVIFAGAGIVGVVVAIVFG